MSTEFIDRNVNSPKKKISIKKKGDAYKVIRSGCGEENIGKRITTIYAGDIIKLPLEKIEFCGEFADYLITAYESSEDNFLAYEPTDESLEFSITDSGESFKIKIKAPEVPEIATPIIGPGPYGAAAGWGKLERKTAMRRWIDECIAAGKTGMRVIPLSYAWDERVQECLIARNPEGKFIIGELDKKIAARFRGDLWYAAANGIRITVDAFDWVHLKDQRFLKSPLYAGNNTSREIWPNQLFAGVPDAPPCEMAKMSADNKFERILKGICETDDLHFEYMRYVDNLISLMMPPHCISTGNELETRTGEKNIIKHIANSKITLREVAGSYLWDKKVGIIEQHIVDDFELFQNVSSIRLHSCGHDTVAQKYNFVLPLLNQYPQLKVTFDSDGWRRDVGSARGINRLSFAQESEAIEKATILAGDRFAAWFGKTLSIPDTSEWIVNVQ